VASVTNPSPFRFPGVHGGPPWWLLAAAVIVLVLAAAPAAQAHEPTTAQCRSYGSMRAVVVSPVRPNRSVSRRARRACVRAVRRHVLEHPLPAALIPPLLRRIRGCESSTGPTAAPNYRAENRSSTASGGYQYLDSTWGSVDGWTHAADAPPRTQDMRALRDFERDGTAPWDASKGCWG